MSRGLTPQVTRPKPGRYPALSAGAAPPGYARHVSFGNFARKVRDPSLPHRRRASALGSCVQLYRPIGYHPTLDYLNAKAGPLLRDEGALLRALELLEASRALWHEDVRRYDDRRRAAKRRGRRVPRPAEVSPAVGPAHWYGAPREAALHALRFWRRGRPSRLLGAAGTPLAEDAHATVRLLDATLAAEGRLAPADLAELAALTERLRAPADPAEYQRTRDLRTVLRHVRTAADPPE